jgi:2-keto-4-pentenoate hydratase/2-oxohepta-3-ene-1,7-dioic acid hydratase in catechol pathway
VDGGAIDVELLTAGEYGPDTRSLFEDWEGFVALYAEVSSRSGPAPATPYQLADLGAPVPEPRQVFAIGLNYADHAAEASLPVPEFPVIFTKFPSSLTGPGAAVSLPSPGVDYEAELVAVISREAHQVPASEGWSYVAGLMVGQDLSEREIQRRGPAAQFSMGKSFLGFAPCGPALVTLDEISSPDDLSIRAWIGDEVLQDSRTKELIFSIPELVAYISTICKLLPGDLIFTGTPAGVGLSHTPPRFLRPGETLITEIEGLGRLETRLVSGYGDDPRPA